MIGFYTLGIFVCLALTLVLVVRGLYANAIITLAFLSGSLACQFYGI